MGRPFQKPTAELVRQYHDSLPFDRRLYDQDITGSIAWAQGLVGAGVLTPAEADTLSAGLDEVRAEFARAHLPLRRG